MPAAVLSGLSAPWTAALNAAGRYRITTCTPLAAPLITIALLFTAGRTLGGYALVLGVVLGNVIESVILAVALRRVGWRAMPRWGGSDADLRRVVSQYAPLVAGSLLLTGTTVVDQSMAAMLGPHNVSALSYANKVVLAVMSAANLAVGTPIMTNVAQLVAAGDWPLIRRALWSYTGWLAALTIPATILLVVFSTPIVVLLFQRGSFTAADAQLVGRVQACYLLQIPFHLLGVLAVRFIMAMSHNRVLTVITAVQLVVNVVANLVLMRVFGLAGIALSTSLVFALSMAIAFVVLVMLLRERSSPA
jgi:putative peptidoglycan lipid II flippase